MNATSDTSNDAMHAMKMMLTRIASSECSNAVTNSSMISADASNALNAASVMLKRIRRARR